MTFSLMSLFKLIYSLLHLFSMRFDKKQLIFRIICYFSHFIKESNSHCVVGIEVLQSLIYFKQPITYYFLLEIEL